MLTVIRKLAGLFALLWFGTLLLSGVSFLAYLVAGVASSFPARIAHGSAAEAFMQLSSMLFLVALFTSPGGVPCCVAWAALKYIARKQPPTYVQVITTQLGPVPSPPPADQTVKPAREAAPVRRGRDAGHRWLG